MEAAGRVLGAPSEDSLQALVAERLNGFIDSLANKLALDPAGPLVCVSFKEKANAS